MHHLARIWYQVPIQGFLHIRQALETKLNHAGHHYGSDAPMGTFVDWDSEPLKQYTGAIWASLETTEVMLL